MVAAKYGFFKDANGELRYRPKAANGETFASSEGYQSKAAAENDINRVRTKHPMARWSTNLSLRKLRTT